MSLGSIIQHGDKVACGGHNHEQVPDEMEIGHPISGEKHDSGCNRRARHTLTRIGPIGDTIAMTISQPMARYMYVD